MEQAELGEAPESLPGPHFLSFNELLFSLGFYESSYFYTVSSLPTPSLQCQLKEGRTWVTVILVSPATSSVQDT